MVAMTTTSGDCRPQVALSLDAEEMAPKAVIHSDIDTAAAIGLIPTAEAMRPAWCDEEFCQAVSYSQASVAHGKPLKERELFLNSRSRLIPIKVPVSLSFDEK